MYRISDYFIVIIALLINYYLFICFLSTNSQPFKSVRPLRVMTSLVMFTEYIPAPKVHAPQQTLSKHTVGIQQTGFN